MRTSIANLETMISNAERRGIMTGETRVVPRICDLNYLVASCRGKIEMTLAEEDGAEDKLVKSLIGEAVKRGLASEADRATWERQAAARPQQVVRGVREKLGRATYGAVLRERFGLSTAPSHTEVQGLLVRLPFRGHITTNYDPGLLEARRLLRPTRPRSW